MMELSRYCCYKDVLPFAAMFSTECAVVGINTLFKAASSEGMSYYVFTFYSSLLNTLVLVPFLLFFCRRRTLLPSLQAPLILRLCILGIIGFSAQIVGYKGVEFSSPTLASAMNNLSPAFTFVLAVIFRMEKLALKSSSTQAKIIGTTVSISGALVVVLYKGSVILSLGSPSVSISLHQLMWSSHSKWIIGGVLLAAQYLLYSTQYIIQAHIMQIFPSEITLTFSYNLCITIIAAPVCFIAEPSLSAWKIRPGIGLVALGFTGIFGASFITFLQSWVVRSKGPVYVTTFTPVSIAIAAATSVIFLGDVLYLGSVIGAVMIATGVYTAVWGKVIEEKMYQEYSPSSLESSSVSSAAPLLQSYEVGGGRTEEK